MKKLIVISLETLCGWLDALPRYDREDHRWYRSGCWGCYPLGLAQKSSDLDERWKTGVWK